MSTRGEHPANLRERNQHLVSNTEHFLFRTDLNMPLMSGFELLAMIRCQFPAIPLIAMSGAFSGRRVPIGVSADAFYEKATHPVLLVQLVDAMTCHRVVQNQTA